MLEALAASAPLDVTVPATGVTVTLPTTVEASGDSAPVDVTVTGPPPPGAVIV